MGVRLGTVSLTAHTSFIDLKHSAADAALVAGTKMAEGYVPIPISSPGYEFPVQEFPLRRHAAGANRALGVKKEALAPGPRLQFSVIPTAAWAC